MKIFIGLGIILIVLGLCVFILGYWFGGVIVPVGLFTLLLETRKEPNNKEACQIHERKHDGTQ